MNHSAVQIDLVGLLGLNEDSLRLVALLSWENLVCFCGSDGERSSDGSELGFLDERGVSDVSDINAFSFWQEADGVFCSLFAKSVSRERKSKKSKPERHTKQYPTLPIFLKPCSFNHAKLFSTIGSTTSTVCFANHPGKSKSWGRLIFKASPLKRSGMMV